MDMDINTPSAGGNPNPRSRAGTVLKLPDETHRPYRCHRAGAKLKAKQLARRCSYKSAVPSMIMGNANLLLNMIDELAALVKNIKTYKECSVFCFCETWLTANMALPASAWQELICGKRKGGGVTVYVTTRWCNPEHVNIKISICCRDLELLVVSLCPYYLPREF